MTFAYAAARQFVKWAPHHPELDLLAEAERMRWAGRFVRVPEVLEVGTDNDGSWLRTVALPGRSAVDPYWLGRPRTAARAIGTGLRVLHDRLPVADCPFSWTVETRMAWAAESERAALLRDAPPVDRLVVCHADACAPNTLLDDRGEPAGHVDLVRLGVADRWADLAIATYSLGWNFEGDWEGELLDAYGIDRDEERIRYYRRLWDAT
jgi:kanamycin kinase